MVVVLVVVLALVAVVPLLLAVLWAGLRWQIPPVVKAVRQLNKRVTNRRVIGTAGSESSHTAVIVHVGRKSGREYSTPVDVVPAGDAFVIALPYGTTADWMRNVFAAGSATVGVRGERIAVDRPELVETAEVRALLPRGARVMLGVFGVRQCLRVHRVVPVHG
ncbi:nitroreductase family deazaflavin-dependent oxidoreductase [Nocardia asteroides]|uniref:nitroreductase family deazaflavin-dependent oxidoreductase n=1 Tax=Nocardia asteroides TaxID=1824 RepID=UPI001E5F3E14|nr:nitroreductase family deazaflavin-dependent oxidoreductase [Nocardia asteroides]UGT62710.1 nitroreductase family deazaflavin-dependent oxidoreductase [Nocardia asteroides]